MILGSCLKHYIIYLQVETIRRVFKVAGKIDELSFFIVNSTHLKQETDILLLALVCNSDRPVPRP